MELNGLARGPEFDLIRSFAGQASLRHPLVRVGAGDDCTIVGDLAISVDVSVDNVHFRRAWLDAEEIGSRAVGAALSDLAAVAAEPVGVLLTCILPDHDRGAFVHGVMRGAITAAESAGAALLGGDLTAGATFAIDVVAVGRALHPVLRSGARPGDELWVTGALGGAAAALSSWLQGGAPAPIARARYARVEPRIALARWLAAHAPLTAMIDISDGLYGDIAHIAAASNCRIVVEAGAVPVDVAAGATFEHAVHGGEDYELCFTAGAGVVDAVRERCLAELNVPLTRIGSVAGGSGVLARQADGSTRPVEHGGFQHFTHGAG